MTNYTIVNRNDKVLWSGEAASLREALEKAVMNNTALTEAALTYATLTRADIRGAKLSEANLYSADLTQARLRKVAFTRAELSYANLTDADLTEANLADADLTSANLTNADLEDVNLTNADLTNAILTGASLGDAILDGVNLEAAYTQVIEADIRSILTAAPHEVAGLKAALIAGEVDGSMYTGSCACLIGTIANLRHFPFCQLGLEHPALTPESDRPAEKWFLAIKPNMPVTHPVVALTLKWIDRWEDDARRIALAYAP